MPKHPSPNDQRSNAKNPNHPSYAADQTNRQTLGHANVHAAPKSKVKHPVRPKK